MLISEDIYELFPRRKYFSDIGEMLCKNEAATHEICTAAMFLLTGFDYVQFNTVRRLCLLQNHNVTQFYLQSMMPTILKIYPAGTSVKVAVHVYQVLTTGMPCNLKLFVLPIMRLFKGNFESLYHRTDPHAKDSPLTGYTYNMSKVVAPISLHYGDGDTIVRKQVSFSLQLNDSESMQTYY